MKKSLDKPIVLRQSASKPGTLYRSIIKRTDRGLERRGRANLQSFFDYQSKAMFGKAMTSGLLRIALASLIRAIACEGTK